MLRIFAVAGCGIVFILLLLVVYVAISPKPFLLWIRRRFSGEADLKYPVCEEELRKSVVVERDRIYPSERENNRYDIYLPISSEKCPLIFWIHGGAFVGGGKEGVKNWGMMLASRGFAVAAPDYAYVPEITYPGQVKQMQECLRELIRRSGEEKDFPVDANRIFLAGDSAGAHIAAQCALLTVNPVFAEEIGLSSELKPDSLRGTMFFCGAYDVQAFLTIEQKVARMFVEKIGIGMFGTRKWRDHPLLGTTTIKNYVTEDFPPCFLTDGNTGSFESQARELEEALARCYVKVTGLFFPPEEGSCGHEYQYDLTSPQGRRCWKESMRFLEENSEK